jgi:hypothetical protein
MLKRQLSRLGRGAIARRRAGWTSDARRVLVAALCLCAIVGGCASSAASSTAATPPGPMPTSAEMTDGRFHLTFEMPKTTWSTTETIEGTATLSLSGDGSLTISGPGYLIGYAFATADGGRHIVPIWQTECLIRTVTVGEPITAPLGRSGDGWTAEELADPALHLTPGDWTISAVAQFQDGAGCLGPLPNLTASISIHVTA